MQILFLSSWTYLVSLNSFKLEFVEYWTYLRGTKFPKTAWNSMFKQIVILRLFCLQKTCQSANEVRQRADKLMKDGHFDPEAIWNCADNMSRRWQQLMSKSEERRKVVTASYSFFKSAEQVTTTVAAGLHEPGLNTDPGQSESQERLPG